MAARRRIPSPPSSSPLVPLALVLGQGGAGEGQEAGAGGGAASPRPARPPSFLLVQIATGRRHPASLVTPMTLRIRGVRARWRGSPVLVATWRERATVGALDSIKFHGSGPCKRDRRKESWRMSSHRPGADPVRLLRLATLSSPAQREVSSYRCCLFRQAGGAGGEQLPVSAFLNSAKQEEHEGSSCQPQPFSTPLIFAHRG